MTNRTVLRSFGRSCARIGIAVTAYLMVMNGTAGYALEVPERDPGDATRPTVGLVLSGGGARGAAHVGVLKVLDELRIPIDYIAGTSMGAIVGGLYASGMTADELDTLFTKGDWSALLADRPPRQRRSFRRKTDDVGFLVDMELGYRDHTVVFPEGLIQGQNLDLALRRYALPVFDIHNFDELPIPFRAIATDLVTGDTVVQGAGDLATAMRASMSAPGIFKPVRDDGRVLVDGGVANNLPVRIVQDLGADVLIVVDVGFPLLAQEQLTSALNVTKQMLTILINGRAREQIALMSADDLLLSPDLAGIASQDFHRMHEAVRRGVESARGSAARLQPLALSQAGYLTHRQRIARMRNGPPVVDAIIVESESRLSPRVLEARLSDLTGKPLDVTQLESDLSDVYSLDTFETVSYALTEAADETALHVRATPKRWGPDFIRFGINLEDDFDGNSHYNLAARLTRTEINALGGEIRADVQIGETPKIFAEVFQPLDYGSRWFVNAQVEVSRGGSTLFDQDGAQLAEIGSDNLGIALFGGRQFGNWGELRVGLVKTWSDSRLRVGVPEFTGSSSEVGSVQIEFNYDNLDRVSVPTAGTNISLDWIGARTGLGTDFSVDIATLSLVKPHTFGANTILHWWSLGSITNARGYELAPLSLGGLFNLSGYAPQEISGAHVGIGRLLYYRRIGQPVMSGFATRTYVGASLEVGNVWDRRDDIGFNNTLTAGSIFVIVDSMIGPLYLGYGAAEGGERSAYLFLGQTF